MADAGGVARGCSYANSAVKEKLPSSSPHVPADPNGGDGGVGNSGDTDKSPLPVGVLGAASLWLLGVCDRELPVKPRQLKGAATSSTCCNRPSTDASLRCRRREAPGYPIVAPTGPCRPLQRCHCQPPSPWPEALRAGSDGTPGWG
eukprot:scaffold452_cov491-Prasinococcus_capsulatus_cf.AAC.4